MSTDAGVGSRRGPDATTGFVFLLFVLIGGSNFVAVRFSNFELPPFWGAGTRFALASLIFFWIAVLARVPFPRGRALASALLYGTLSFGVFYALVYYALVHVTSGLAAVTLGLAPLTTFLLAYAQRLERFRVQSLLGAAVSAVGLAIVFWDQLAQAIPPLALASLVLASAAAAQGSIVAKRTPQVAPLAMNAIGLGAGALLLLVGSAVATEPRIVPTRAETWIAFVYLVTVGSVALFFSFLFVLARWTASATAYAFVLFPVVATILGAWLAQEPVTLPFVAGSTLVLLGVYVGALRGRGATRPEPAPAPMESAVAPALPSPETPDPPR